MTASDETTKDRARRGADGLFRRFLTEVDPEGVMDPEDRVRLAEEARRAHMRSLITSAWDRRRALRAAAEAAGIDVSGVKL
ncbi:MAG: hypothetical protein M3R02_15105 [Chloroflexota bacterium]|nr:hypothetical protein [Chloroflexota bacterium]